jgi:hypothetical protein
VSLSTRHIGVSKFEAKLIFSRSKMASTDEFKRRQRVISQTFVDFLEAVVRLADKINLPSVKELQDWMKLNVDIRGEGGEKPRSPRNPYWVYCKNTRTMASSKKKMLIMEYSPLSTSLL